MSASTALAVNDWSAMGHSRDSIASSNAASDATSIAAATATETATALVAPRKRRRSPDSRAIAAVGNDGDGTANDRSGGAGSAVAATPVAPALRAASPVTAESRVATSTDFDGWACAAATAALLRSPAMAALTGEPALGVGSLALLRPLLRSAPAPATTTADPTNAVASAPAGVVPRLADAAFLSRAGPRVAAVPGAVGSALSVPTVPLFAAVSVDAAWTAEEDAALLDLYLSHGPQWALLARLHKRFDGRFPPLALGSDTNVGNTDGGGGKNGVTSAQTLVVAAARNPRQIERRCGLLRDVTAAVAVAPGATATDAARPFHAAISAWHRQHASGGGRSMAAAARQSASRGLASRFAGGGFVAGGRNASGGGAANGGEGSGADSTAASPLWPLSQQPPGRCAAAPSQSPCAASASASLSSPPGLSPFSSSFSASSLASLTSASAAGGSPAGPSAASAAGGGGDRWSPADSPLRALSPAIAVAVSDASPPPPSAVVGGGGGGGVLARAFDVELAAVSASSSAARCPVVGGRGGGVLARAFDVELAAAAASASSLGLSSSAMRCPAVAALLAALPAAAPAAPLAIGGGVLSRAFDAEIAAVAASAASQRRPAAAFAAVAAPLAAYGGGVLSRAFDAELAAAAASASARRAADAPPLPPPLPAPPTSADGVEDFIRAVVERHVAPAPPAANTKRGGGGGSPGGGGISGGGSSGGGGGGGAAALEPLLSAMEQAERAVVGSVSDAVAAAAARGSLDVQRQCESVLPTGPLPSPFAPHGPCGADEVHVVVALGVHRTMLGVAAATAATASATPAPPTTSTPATAPTTATTGPGLESCLEAHATGGRRADGAGPAPGKAAPTNAAGAIAGTAKGAAPATATPTADSGGVPAPAVATAGSAGSAALRGTPAAAFMASWANLESAGFSFGNPLWTNVCEPPRGAWRSMFPRLAACIPVPWIFTAWAQQQRPHVGQESALDALLEGQTCAHRAAAAAAAAAEAAAAATSPPPGRCWSPPPETTAHATPVGRIRMALSSLAASAFGERLVRDNEHHLERTEPSRVTVA